jgi:hypothetical protein
VVYLSFPTKSPAETSLGRRTMRPEEINKTRSLSVLAQSRGELGLQGSGIAPAAHASAVAALSPPSPDQEGMQIDEQLRQPVEEHLTSRQGEARAPRESMRPPGGRPLRGPFVVLGKTILARARERPPEGDPLIPHSLCSSDGRYWARTRLPHSGHRWTGVVNADVSRSSTDVAAVQRKTAVDTADTRFERPCGRNVDGIGRDESRREALTPPPPRHDRRQPRPVKHRVHV